MSDTMIYPPGTAVMFETGEYSDYGVSAVLITLKELDLKAAAQRFQDTVVNLIEWGGIDHDAFIAWLVTEGYAMAADVNRLHVGSYGRWATELEVKLPE